ncbi:MAG: DNA adenine methylase [Acidobacteria bacterium]|nr:DNA adenine methylase [Acidobacteriota bacterium]
MAFSQQQNLFESGRTRPVINVASVPQRSPFRYPGGKTWLVPYIRSWLKSLKTRPTLFVEPFAGGGIVSLTVAAENLAERVLMVELDEQVAAVWQTILGGDAGWLAEQIVSFKLTSENAAEALSTPTQSIRGQAFQTILKNRIAHGGILAPGAGIIKDGENGKGIRSRWYPETLRDRILGIEALKERITFVQGDGVSVMREHAKLQSAAFFIDPPYTVDGKKAGKRLYTHSELNHQSLFEVTASLAGDFLMSYDNADAVRQLASQRGFNTQLVAMKNTHHAKMSELLIGRLDWLYS